MNHHFKPARLRQCALTALLMTALAGCTDSTVRVASTDGNATPPGTADPAQSGTQQPGPVTQPTTVAGSGTVPPDLAHRNATRLLAQASFGPRYGEITALAQSGDYAAWLDQQFALPAETTSVLIAQATSVRAQSEAGRFARTQDILFLVTGSPAFNLQY